MPNAHKTALLFDNRKNSKVEFLYATLTSKPFRGQYQICSVNDFLHSHPGTASTPELRHFFSFLAVESCLEFFLKLCRNSIITSSGKKPGTSQSAPSPQVPEFHLTGLFLKVFKIP